MGDDDFRFYEMGVDALAQDRLDDALHHFQSSNSIWPHYKTLERLAHVFSRLGQVDAATQALEDAFKLNPKSDSVASQLADVFLRNNNLPEADRLVSEILGRNSTYGPAKTLQAEIRRRKGENTFS
jgi:tetratricopeptide (TPR) repeat protein